MNTRNSVSYSVFNWNRSSADAERQQAHIGSRSCRRPSQPPSRAATIVPTIAPVAEVICVYSLACAFRSHCHPRFVAQVGTCWIEAQVPSRAMPAMAAASNINFTVSRLRCRRRVPRLRPPFRGTGTVLVLPLDRLAALPRMVAGPPGTGPALLLPAHLPPHAEGSRTGRDSRASLPAPRAPNRRYAVQRKILDGPERNQHDRSRRADQDAEQVLRRPVRGRAARPSPRSIAPIPARTGG